MQYTRNHNKIEGVQSFPGLFTARLEHEIKETKTNVTYIGPDIPQLEWEKVLSFFKWTYDTAHSESQVRLYVNPELNTWKAWAWPQEASTGMTAHELDIAWEEEQTRLFNADEGWINFGTAHHHCGGGAFQSGTDAANERMQAGLHITVGSMGAARYDMHARFYVAEQMLIPDMSLFWDIGEELLIRLPKDLHDRVARHQMCTPSTIVFPQEWKDNYREVKRVTIPFAGSGSGSGSGVTVHGVGSYDYRDHYAVPEWKRIEYCCDELIRMSKSRDWTLESMTKFLNSLCQTDEREILEKIKLFKLDPWQVMSEMNWLAKHDFDRDKAKAPAVHADDPEEETVHSKVTQALIEDKKAAFDESELTEDEANAWIDKLRDGGAM